MRRRKLRSSRLRRRKLTPATKVQVPRLRRRKSRLRRLRRRRLRFVAPRGRKPYGCVRGSGSSPGRTHPSARETEDRNHGESASSSAEHEEMPTSRRRFAGPSGIAMAGNARSSARMESVVTSGDSWNSTTSSLSPEGAELPSRTSAYGAARTISTKPNVRSARISWSSVGCNACVDRRTMSARATSLQVCGTLAVARSMLARQPNTQPAPPAPHSRKACELL